MKIVTITIKNRFNKNIIIKINIIKSVIGFLNSEIVLVIMKFIIIIHNDSNYWLSNEICSNYIYPVCFFM